MIRILQVVSAMHQGGLENLIMNIYRNIDRNKIQFDFITHHMEKSDFDDEIEKMGGKIYRFSFLDDKNIFKYIKDLNNFFKEHKEYKIIHGHLTSVGFLYLGVAKKYGVPVRITHAHGTNHENNIKGYIKGFGFKLNKYPANYYYACSKLAGEYLFGKNSNFEFIPNGIETEKFQYNEKKRKEIRKELKLNNNDIVIGNVGRFEQQKNHKFIIEIFEELYNINHNYKLILVGKGKLEQEIKNMVKEKAFCKNVIFLGVRKDVYNIYQAMDIFLLPSFFEGLPLTGVEAQYAKLECFFSDSITEEVKISNNCYFLSLNLSSKEWAKKINEKIKYNRNDNIVTNNQFEIQNATKILQDKYLKLYEQNKE